MKRIFLLMACVTSITLAHAQKLTELWKSDTTLRVPESVYFDTKGKVLYVSNIDGKSDAKDGNGFISKLSTNGKIETLMWATGLDAPKGMGVVGTTLYVADLSRVAMIDTKTGKVTKMVDIEGAQFLNDITTDAKGNVYVSDSATGKIHVIKNGKGELYFSSADLKRVNGLLALADGMYVADAGTGTNYKLSSDLKLTKFATTSNGADGIAMVGKNEYIVSSWGGEIFFVNAQGESVKMLDTSESKTNSADIGYDPATSTIFVPTFFKNSVVAYKFER
ncbi:MAG: ATP/GTP-binding protein [Bacteroidia bacterium]|nr:ATP/GTP-binding protein [Bacteroidia bacterium]